MKKKKYVFFQGLQLNLYVPIRSHTTQSSGFEKGSCPRHNFFFNFEPKQGLRPHYGHIFLLLLLCLFPTFLIDLFQESRFWARFTSRLFSLKSWPLFIRDFINNITKYQAPNLDQIFHTCWFQSILICEVELFIILHVPLSLIFIRVPHLCAV